MGGILRRNSSKIDIWEVIAINMMLFLAGQKLPDDLELVYLVRRRMREINEGLNTIYSMAEMVEKFGGSSQSLNGMIIDLQNQREEGRSFYFQADMDVLIRGIRNGLIENRAFHTDIFFHHVDDFIGNAGAGDAFVGDDQGLLGTQRLNLIADLFVSADTHQRYGRNEETKYLFLNCHVITLLSDELNLMID